MDAATGLGAKLSDARIHLDDFGHGGAPSGCSRAKCGVILGERSERIVQTTATVTCVVCLEDDEPEVEEPTDYRDPDADDAGESGERSYLGWMR